jgi:hypothetical protein
MDAQPVQAAESYWKPVSTGGLVAMILGAAYLMLLLFTDDDGFIQILDSFNLVVHEFGHPFFGIFGGELGWWGGTLMQLLVPLTIAVAFFRERAALSFALAGVWFFENFLNIARYVSDARAEELPLIGGGEHDWAHILGNLGLLESDVAIGSALRMIGWTGMLASVGFAIAVWVSQRSMRESVAEPRPLR